jgi:hypothetical protein
MPRGASSKLLQLPGEVVLDSGRRIAFQSDQCVLTFASYIFSHKPSKQRLPASEQSHTSGKAVGLIDCEALRREQTRYCVAVKRA